MATTTPDSIYYPTASDQIAPLETVFATQASSVQTALKNRAVYGYRWDNAASRTAQTGMRNGDRGWQVDNNTEYQYLGGAWRAWGLQTGTFSSAGAFTLNEGTLQKDPSGTVTGNLQWSGTIAAGAYGVAAGSLPVGFRPIVQVQTAGFASGNAVPSPIGINIATNGQVTVHNPGGAHTIFGGNFMFKAGS